MSLRWALIAMLTFLVTPMVFWQITTSGSPDIWMGFYVTVTLLAACRGIERQDLKLIVLSGLFAGCAAAVKYTGFIIPIAICGYLFLFYRPRHTAVYAGFAAMLGGGFPLLRNFLWTRDPVFPFLTRWIDPAHVNHYALGALLAATRSKPFSLAPQKLLAFPLALTLNGNDLGLGQYFGPLILALAPLLVFVSWKSKLAQLCGLTACLVFVVNALTSQMGRFLLPIYPIALVLVFSGTAELMGRGWRLANRACLVTIAPFLMFACAADTLYAKTFLPVLVGREGRVSFLERMAPDFQFASFVNDTLAKRALTEHGRTLVFIRHLFYIRVPYVNADPSSSWAMNPAICGDPSSLLRCLQDQNVKWVAGLRSFSGPLASAFSKLVLTGKLIPIARTQVEYMTGTTRLEGQTGIGEAIIWELHP